MHNTRTDQIEDQAILEAFRKGDGSGVTLLFNKYLHVVYGICLKYLKNRDEAQDAASELFEKLIEISLPDDIQNLKTWLYVVAKNHCLMKLRGKKSVMTDISSINFVESEEEMHPLDKALLKEKELDALNKCLETLKIEQKQCVTLFYLQKHCYDEISKTTGFAIKKVKSYIQNGKRNLKICMQKLK